MSHPKSPKPNEKVARRMSFHPIIDVSPKPKTYEAYCQHFSSLQAGDLFLRQWELGMPNLSFEKFEPNQTQFPLFSKFQTLEFHSGKPGKRRKNWLR